MINSVSNVFYSGSEEIQKCLQRNIFSWLVIMRLVHFFLLSNQL